MGTTRRDFCAEVEFAWKGDRYQLVFFLGEHRLVSFPLCRCVSPLVGQKKNWVRRVPLLGSELLNLSAWAERGETRFCCFQSM